jgi:penicillin-binding protein 1C
MIKKYCLRRPGGKEGSWEAGKPGSCEDKKLRKLPLFPSSLSSYLHSFGTPRKNFLLIKNFWKSRNLFIKRFLAAGGIVLLVVLFLIYLGVRGRIRLESPGATPFFEDCQGNYISEGWGNDAPKGYWKIQGPIPHRVKECFIAIEDKRFYSHSGIDYYSLGRAIWNNLTGGPRHGASTIAMQAARLQNPGKRTYWKKLCEIVIARLLTAKYGKEAVLRQYFCLVPMGNRIHGTAYAARRFFKKPLQDLGWAEAALLAALPKAPGDMNLFTRKGFEHARQRARLVLNLLRHQEKINIEEYRTALRHLKSLTPPIRDNRPFHSYHAIMQMEAAMKAKGIRSFHQPVRTTLDLDLQNFLSDVSWDAMKACRPLGAGNIALLVVERETGKIRGYLGSEYYYDDHYAGAIDYAQTPRSAGSTLKPFIYALGLAEKKYTPASVLGDLPFYITHPSGQYLVGNYDNRYLGPLVYRKALANSRNVAAVQVLKEVGLENVHGFFRRIGLEQSNHNAAYYGLGLAIGGLYVTLADLVRSYGILANNGRDFSLTWFEQGNESKSENIPVQVLPEEVARQVTLFLSDPLARRPSFYRMGPLEYPFPVAVKTGTSQGFRDAWAVAWSHKYIVGAWIGHPNSDRMKKVNGLAAARVVKRIMLRLHPGEDQGIQEIPFALPRGYQAVKVCTLSGQRANDFCSEVLLEYFKPGTEPAATCGIHRRYPIDRRTGALADSRTPSADIEIKTFVVLPPEYSAWAAQQGYEKPPVETHQHPRAAIEIRHPLDRSRVLIDPETPRQFQTLALKARVTPAVPQVIWVIDGKPHQPTPYPYVVRWQLEPGEHTFQVRFPRAGVFSEPVRITVTEY